MPELLDISTDDAVMDGQFTVLVRRSVVQSLSDSVLSPRGIVREVNFREVAASGGKYRTGDVIVSIAENSLAGFIPEPGDILAVDGPQFPGEFEILESSHATLHTRYRMVARQPRLSTTGAATCSILRDTSGADGMGAPIVRRQLIAASVPCAIKRTQNSERIEQGRRTIEDRVFLVVGKTLSIEWGPSIWFDVNGVRYRVVSVLPRELGEFQELEVSRQP